MKKASDFSIGDRVVIQDLDRMDDWALVTDTGTITEIEENGSIVVRPDKWSGGTFHVTPGQLELVRTKKK